jgi:putative peptidoglycan lipid II flippase
MSPYLVFIGVATILMSPLQALRRFLPVAGHPILFNLSLIGCGLAAFAFPGPSFAFATGVVLGGALQVLALAIPAARAGIPLFRPGLPSLSDPALREVVRLTVPSLAGVALMRLNSLVDVRFASGLPAGSLACLQYGFLIYTAIMGVAGVGISTVYFTSLSEARAQEDEAAFAACLRRGVSLVLLVSAPACAVGVAFPEALAGLLSGGRFGAEELAATSGAVRGYAAGLLAGGLYNIVARAHHAGKNQRLVVASGAVAAAVNIYLDWRWVGPYGVTGLAGATAVALWINVGVLSWWLRRELTAARLIGPLARSLAASLLACLPCIPASEAFSSCPPLLLPLYALAYLAILHVARTPEYKAFRGMFSNRVPEGPGDDG